MKDSFEVAFEFLLKWEGGYSDNPKDPGGTTKYGISQRAYPELNIKALTKKQAKEIYKRDYWLKAKCDELPFPIDMIVFDTAVNCGVRKAIQILELATCWRDAILRRIEYYTKLKNFNHFGRGWINRCVALARLIEKIRGEEKSISLLVGGEKEE